jgi:hypothetical protein
MNPRRLVCAALLACAAVPSAHADGAADNIAENVRRIPPPGVAIPDDARAELTSRAAALQASLAAAATDWEKLPDRTRFLPDAEVFWKAVDWALRHDEIYDVKHVDWARAQLAEGEKRLAALARDEKPWLAQTGLVVRGYRSRLDDSVQPFGLVVPPSFQANLPHRWRLDAWFHGRGEKLTELDFIHQRTHSPGEFTPQDTIVLHPYGRYCNGSRFAGETDFFEALAIVQRDYRIDDDRMVVRGFSLGGAACWHLAAHHAWRWCAAAPGAGFSETEEFLNFFQGETLQPAPWERKLWSLYDATAVAANFFNLPTVAYSGETDRQKQAADAMAKALEKEGMTLTHIIGPKTAHSYEAGAKAEINRRIDALAAIGRRPRLHGAWTTASLKYHRFPLGTIDRLENHWDLARVEYHLGTGEDGRPQLRVNTTNISELTLTVPTNEAAAIHGPLGVALGYPDGRGGTYAPSLPITRQSDGSYHQTYHVTTLGTLTGWKPGPAPSDGLRKKHGLQGPIDDAFMDRFLFVRPTGTAAHEKTGAWAQAEMARAIEQWRRQFRGDARVKDDTQVTDEDIATSNLVLWGDPSSNAVMAKIADTLPIRWTAGELKAGDRVFPAANHALVAIYPNPLTPEKYVVLNSGFTFREYDQLNNARQTPKLPDWAVIDLDTPPNSRHPGNIAAADFFGEQWELKPATP